MAKHPFFYQGKQFSNARRVLMAPHPKGDEHGFEVAFMYCRNALSELNLEHVEDEEARQRIATVERLMNSDRDLSFEQRARRMTLEDKEEFSKAVDGLASYFDREFWSSVSE